MSSESNRSSNRTSNRTPRSGNVSLSGSSNSVSSTSNVNSTDDVDIIYDEDLADVDKDISLGNAQQSESSLEDGLSVDELEFEVYDSKGYIDDAIVQSVMDSADKRLVKKRISENKRVLLCAFGAVALLVTFIGVSLSTGSDSEAREVEKIIKEKASAFEFDDHDDYIKLPVDKAPKNATTEAGKTEAATTEAATTEAATAEAATNEVGKTEAKSAETETVRSNTTETVESNTTKTEVTDAKEPGTFALETGESSSLMESEIPLGDTTVFPFPIQNYLADPRVVTLKTDSQTPFFWQVPFAGGVFQSYMSSCAHKVLASNHKDANDDEIKKYKVRDSEYVNVDLSTPAGIQDAADKGITESGLADIYVSYHVHLITNSLFDSANQGRFFAAMRHPVDRAINEYHFVTSTTSDPEIKSLSLDEFATSRYMDKDWMTRFLINKRQVPLVREDLELAKEILRKRCVVGLHEDIEGSIDLFEQFFGWKFNSKTGKVAHGSCVDSVIETERHRARTLYGDFGSIEKGSPVYNKIVEVNKFDMELYWYGNDLFKEQKEWVKSFRLSENEDLS